MLVDIPPLNPTRNPTPLSSRYWLIALVLILVGLGTFVAPMFTTDPPVLSRAHWSPLDILTQMQAGTLPVSNYHHREPWGMDPVTIDFVLQYVPLLVALLAVVALPSTNLLRGVATWGVLFWWRGIKVWEFELLFYTSPTRFDLFDKYRRVHSSQPLMLAIINLLLLGITFLPDKD
jgi:hypothetical protein